MDCKRKNVFRQYSVYVFCGLLACASLLFATGTYAKIMSDDGLVSIEQLSGQPLEHRVESWADDYMYDLLQHAATQYAYVLEGSGTVELTFQFPEDDTESRWRVYQKTSEKVGWLIVTKYFNIADDSQTITATVNGISEFILIADDKLLETDAFDHGKLKTGVVTNGLHSEGTVSIEALKKGTVLEFGTVGLGTLELHVADSNATEPAHVRLYKFTTSEESPNADWKFVFDKPAPSGTTWVWRPKYPNPAYRVWRMTDVWYEISDARLTERSVSYDVSGHTTSHWQVRPFVRKSSVDVILTNYDSDSNISIVPEISEDMYQIRWSAREGISTWCVKCYGDVVDAATMRIPIPDDAYAVYGKINPVTGGDVVTDTDVALAEPELLHNRDEYLTACDDSPFSIHPLPYVFTGSASWYPTYMSSRAPAGYGAAMNKVPQNSWVTVTNMGNDKSVTVKIVSTGPYADGRIIDFTSKAFAEIAPIRSGVVKDVLVKPATRAEVALVSPAEAGTYVALK